MTDIESDNTEKLNNNSDDGLTADEKVMNDLSEIVKLSVKPEELENKTNAALEMLMRELSVLQKNITDKICDVLSKILIQDEIKLLCEETVSGLKNGRTLLGVVQKQISELKTDDERRSALLTQMKDLLSKFDEYPLSESCDKIDMIYDNMSFVNNWANSSDKLSDGLDNLGRDFASATAKIDVIYDNMSFINNWAGSSDKVSEDFENLSQDFEVTSGKVDIIYENITFLNEWVKKFNSISKDIDELKNNCNDNNLSQKVTEIFDKVGSLNEWGKKADALVVQMNEISSKIVETENSLNTQIQDGIKRLFSQMNDSLSKIDEKSYELIAESEKSDEIIKNKIENLTSVVSDFVQKPQDNGVRELTKKVDEIRKISAKNTDFEQVVTESFVYLAEWIDAAGSALNSLKNDIKILQETSKEQVESIEQLKNTPAENPAIPRILLEVQSISETLDNNIKKDNLKSNEVGNEEMKTLLEYIAAQLTEQNKNSDENEKISALAEKTESFAEKTDVITEKIETLENRMDSIEGKIDSVENKMASFEEKLSSVENYLSKLIEYLEED